MFYIIYHSNKKKLYLKKSLVEKERGIRNPVRGLLFQNLFWKKRLGRCNGVK